MGRNKPYFKGFLSISAIIKSRIKQRILDNRLIIKDFFRVTSGIRTHDIQNHNLTL